MKNKTKLFMAIFIAFIMISSVLGFALLQSFGGLGLIGNNRETFTYNNLEFTQSQSGFYSTNFQNKEILLVSDPRTLNNVKVPQISINELNNAEKIYVTQDSTQNTQSIQSLLMGNIGQFLIPRVQVACISDTKECVNLPLITCNDATQTIKVIYFEESNETDIIYENNCLTIKGSSDIQTLRKIDKLILTLLGI